MTFCNRQNVKGQKSDEWLSGAWGDGYMAICIFQISWNSSLKAVDFTICNSYISKPDFKNVLETDNTKCWKGCGKLTWYSRHWLWAHKMVKPFWKTVWQLSMKFILHLPYNPTTPLLGIYPREMKKCIQTGLHVNVYGSFIQSKHYLEATLIPIS